MYRAEIANSLPRPSQEVLHFNQGSSSGLRSSSANPSQISPMDMPADSRLQRRDRSGFAPDSLLSLS